MNVAEMTVEDTQEASGFTELGDELANFTADLLSFSQNEPFLHKLFSAEAGHWVNVFSLCISLENLERTIEQLQKNLDGSLFATWLDYPDPVGNEDFCTIIFFAPDLMWSNTAVYHKQRFMRQWVHQKNGAGR
jgi:hypothetical protein